MLRNDREKEEIEILGETNIIDILYWNFKYRNKHG